METLADAIGLRMAHLGLGMLNVIECQIQLKVMAVGPATIFCAAVGQDTQHRHPLLGKARQHPIIEQIGRGDRRFSRVELGGSPLRIGVDEGLLVNPADAFDRAYLERVLAAEITRVGGFDFAL